MKLLFNISSLPSNILSKRTQVKENYIFSKSCEFGRKERERYKERIETLSIVNAVGETFPRLGFLESVLIILCFISIAKESSFFSFINV